MTTQSSETRAAAPGATSQKSHELLTCTIKAPRFSYAQLELDTDATKVSDVEPLDILQVRSYCNAALRQFLGVTGSAISIDILHVEGGVCWLRVPRPDLSPFAAAITAWPGVSEQGCRRVLRLKQCSDYLGVMVGADGQGKLWSS
ncbi:hypothetical protein C8034_v009964 [Colletotrichum sidae]|uniref:Ribonucleases P/MRP subunit Pop8-like domain-containing protein n=1 Tax=Colletotrichum sidae TaxID=1347389 RepID=A0A4R8TL40_9PEZI|nr:hypothetical protein C8034_v009964 [Colletotrichum sidae]